MLYMFDGKRPFAGTGTYISPLANIIGDVVIGDNCYIGHGIVLRGDYGRIEIGDGTAVEEGVVVHAPPGETASIGRKVTIGHGAIVHGKRINDMAVIGMGAIVSIWAEIGEWSIIAEGGVVKMRQIIAAGVVAAGNPVKVVRTITDEHKKFWHTAKQRYIDLAKQYLTEGMAPVE